MCYESEDADCISIYEIIRIPHINCLKSLSPKKYCGAVGYYLSGCLRCFHPKNIISLFHVRKLLAWIKFFTFFVSPLISTILFAFAINAFLNFIGVANDLVTVANSWRRQPILDIRTTTGTSCNAGEELFRDSAWLYPGNDEGCRCKDISQLDFRFLKCSYVGSPSGCVDVKSTNAKRINEWNNRRICLKRGGDSVLDREVPNVDGSCPQGHLTCGPFCMRNVTKCPITSFQIATQSTPGAIDMGNNQYLLPLRNESATALPVNDIIIHEEVPCIGDVVRNKRTQLLKGDAAKVAADCKDDNRWKRLLQANETVIYKDHTIPLEMTSFPEAVYYLSYRPEIKWVTAGGRIDSLNDQKYILSQSKYFPLIPYFYEFAFYLTIADFIILTVVVPILAFLTDRLRYNFFPEKLRISRVDTLNQLGLFSDTVAVAIKLLRFAPVGFSFWISVAFIRFFLHLQSAETDPVTQTTITEIASKYVAFGLILNSIALGIAILNFLAASFFLVYAFYSDIHFVLLNYDRISSDYSDAKSFSGLGLAIWLTYKFRIYSIIFDNKKFSLLPFFKKCYGKKYEKREGKVRDFGNNEYFFNQII